MLGLFLLYFIGEKFYKLAALFDRNKWGYAILGIIAYYAGTFVFGVLFWIVVGLRGKMPMETINSTVINIVAVTFGLFSCYGLYKLLQNHWDKNSVEDPGILDDMDI